MLYTGWAVSVVLAFVDVQEHLLIWMEMEAKQKDEYLWINMEARIPLHMDN